MAKKLSAKAAKAAKKAADALMKTASEKAPAGCCGATMLVCGIAVMVVLVYAARCIVNMRRQNASVATEGFANASSSYAMGPYDGVNLRTTDPKTLELQTPTRQNATVQGYQVPLRQPHPGELAHSENYATVDGTDNTPRDMFMFAHNQSHPDCCPSTYSTSTGCVCTTPQQRRWLYKRGGKTDCADK